MDAHRRSKVIVAAIVAAAVLGAGEARAQRAAVLLVSDTEQIPLTAYAEFLNAGILRMANGSHADIPTIDSFTMMRCDLTGWKPVAVMAASQDLFRSEYAERRMLPIATSPVAVSTVLVRVADLERPARVAELHKAIGKPEGGDDAYFFLVLSSGGITRYYPFRVDYAAQR